MNGKLIYKIKETIEKYFLIDDAETSAMIPFKLRKVQAKYFEMLCEEYSEADGFVGLREMILKARKEGFTSLVLAIFAAIMILDDNPSRFLEISYKDDATKQHFTRMKNYVLSYFAAKLSMKYNDPELAKKIFLSYKENEEFTLAHNGSQFYVGSASTKTAERGGTVRGILFTESAHYPDTGIIKASEIIEGTSSQVAVGKGLIFEESTANGFNHFKVRWDQATRGERKYRPRFFSWREFYTEEEFATISGEYSDKAMLKQEYPDSAMEAFLTSGLPFFDKEAIEWYARNVKAPMEFNSEGIVYNDLTKDLFKQWRKFKKGELILVHADTAGGGGDDNYATFLSRDGKDLVMVYQDATTCVNMTNNLHKVLEAIADVTNVKPIVSYERNNGGAFELDRLAALNRHDKYIIYRPNIIGEAKSESESAEDKQAKFGLTVSGTTRPAYLDNAKSIVMDRQLVIPDEVLVAQMSSFVKVKTNSMWKAQAEAGTHDDAVMSFTGTCVLFVDPNITAEFVSVDVGGAEEPEWVSNAPSWSRPGS